MTGIEMLVLLGVMCPVAILILLVVWGVLSYTEPKVAKVIHRAALFHQTLALIMQSNRVARIVRCKIHAQGYLETIEKHPQRIPILRPTFHKPRPEGMGVDKEAEEGEIVKEAQEIYEENLALSTIERDALTATSFEGCRVPVYLVYAGVAIAANPETVLGLQYEKQQFDAEPVGVGNPNSEKSLLKVLLPINPEVLKRHISKLIDQSTLDGVYQDGWSEGYQEGKSMKDWKIYLYALIVLGALVLGGAILIKIM